MAYTPSQRAIARRIKQIGAQVGASPKEIKAALETGIVESNLSNPTGGDRDSAGWRQERASIYKDPTNLNASIRRFYRETAGVKDKYGRAGDLAAAVQRPAAQYRGRYQQHSGEADRLLGRPGRSSTGTADATTSSSRVVGAVDNRAARGALIAQFLGEKKPDALQFALGVRDLADKPGHEVRTTRKVSGSTSGSGTVSAVAKRAEAISRQKLPYVWGGGHGSQAPGTPLDCSGAVSKVLGINPRVASQFKSFGSPGRAPGGKGVTIYASDGHVLMEVNGRFWGTSRSNPGGGAGWIPRSQITPKYLQGFTARHLANS